MSSKYFKQKDSHGMPSFLQKERILKAFPEAKITHIDWESFEVELNLQPTPISNVYRVKLVFNNQHVRVFVVNQTLAIAPNRTKLPHIYDAEKQQLCLYSYKKHEWNGGMYLVDTIIPWASEWLYYYELWLPDGKWYGGGHDEYPNEEKDNIINEEV